MDTYIYCAVVITGTCIYFRMTKMTATTSTTTMIMMMMMMNDQCKFTRIDGDDERSVQRLLESMVMMNDQYNVY